MSSDVIGADRDRLPPGGHIQRFFDKFLFLIAFVLGAGGILAAKSLGLGQIPATIWPVSILLLYALYVIVVARARLREDQAGDNVYYLGFLFTLTSLAYALVLFSADSTNTQDIISNFGIALATTIVGLALRIFLNSMRQEPVEIEREARLELSAAASALRSELDAAVLDFNSFRRATQQSIAEGMEEISSQATDKLTSAVDQFSSASNEMLGTIEDAFADFSENSKQLSKASQQTVRALAKLVERVESIEAPSDLFQQKLSPTLDSIQQVAQRMNERELAEQKRLEQLSTSIGGWSEALSNGQQTSETISRQAEQMSAVVARFESLDERFASFESAIGSAVRDITREVPKQISGITELIEDAYQRANAVTGAFESLSQQQKSQVLDPLSHVVDGSGDIVEAMKALSGQLKTVTDQVASAAQSQIDTVRAHNESLASELHKSQGATLKVQEALIEMISGIERNVRARRQSEQNTDA